MSLALRFPGRRRFRPQPPLAGIALCRPSAPRARLAWLPHPPRTRVLAAALLLGGAAVAARLVQLTVSDHDMLRHLARAQNEDVVRIPGPRGDIVDRHGRVLATSVPVQVLAIEPRKFTSAGLAAIERAAQVPGRLAGRAMTRWFLVRRDCDAAIVAEVQKLIDAGVAPKDGVHWAPGFKRNYLYGQTAAHVLGFVSLDETLAEGIEKYHDERLRSGETRVLHATDARGTGLGSDGAAPFPAAASSLMLTLDLRVQQALEQALRQAREEHGAKGAQGVVLDPATGEVLALANEPSYEPNRYGAADPVARRNAAIEFPFEPGSVMKPLTAAALAQYDLVRDHEQVYCEQGRWRRSSRWTLRDTHAYGWLTLPEVIAVSSNIGIVKFSQRLPSEQLHTVLAGFGLGRRTGIDLPAESGGALSSWQKWRPSDRDTIAFGHSLMLTSLQLAGAVATIANGGVRVPPRIARAMGDPAGDWHPMQLGGEPRRVLSERAANRVALWMLGVVEAERATGHRALVPGYRIGGKTGTAEKIVNGKYDPRKNVGTFVGFGPLASPAAVVVISLDEPTRGAHTGGVVAAPAFATVMRETLRLMRVPPDYLPEIAPDDVAGAGTPPAQAVAAPRVPAPRPGTGAADATPRTRG